MFNGHFKKRSRCGASWKIVYGASWKVLKNTSFSNFDIFVKYNTYSCKLMFVYTVDGMAGGK